MRHPAYINRTYEYRQLENRMAEVFINRYGSGSDYIPMIRELLTVVENSGALKLGQLTPIDLHADLAKRTRQS